MNQRIEKLFESEENIAYLVFDETNRFYLTGFDSDAGAVVLTRDKRYFLVDSRYSEDAQTKCADFEVIEERPSGLHAKICELLKSAEVSAVYLENRTLRHEEYLAAAADFSEFEVRNLGDRLELLRAVKTEDEISKIAAAQGIAERAFEKMKAILKVGVSERDAALMRERARAAGLGLSAYVRRCALAGGAPAPVADARELRPIYAELRRCGNNANQIARALNTYGIGGAPAADVARAVAELERAAEAVAAALEAARP